MSINLTKEPIMERNVSVNIDALHAADINELAKHTHVSVERPFYERLIEVVANSFRSVGFYDLKANLLSAIENAKGTEDLIAVSQEFIDTRAFVDKVVEERDVINTLKN